MFSLVSGWEEGLNSPILAVLMVLSGIATYILCKKWDREGKLPDSVSDRRNDAA